MSLPSGRSQRRGLAQGRVAIPQNDQVHPAQQPPTAGLQRLRLLLRLGGQRHSSGRARQVYKTLLLQTSFLACTFLLFSLMSAGPAYKRLQNSLAAANKAFSHRWIQGKKDVCYHTLMPYY